MSDQPSTSTSGQEAVEDTVEKMETLAIEEPKPAPSLIDPSMSGKSETSTSRQGTNTKAGAGPSTSDQVKWKPNFKAEDLPKILSKEEYFARRLTDLEVTAMQLEWMWRVGTRLKTEDVVKEFLKQSKQVQNQMLQRSYIRRVLVTAANAGDNQNLTMNKIKEIMKRKKCPVPMEEIKYCIRSFEEFNLVDLNIDLKILLAEEAVRNRMKDSPFDCHFIANVRKELRNAKTPKIDSIDIRVKTWNMNTTYIQVNIGDTLLSTAIRGVEKERVDQTLRAIDYVSKLLDLCVKDKVCITKLKLSIADCHWSINFLMNFVLLKSLTELAFDTFELTNPTATISKSLEDFQIINCKVLNITLGKFEGDSMEKFTEALKNFCNKERKVQKMCPVLNIPLPNFEEDTEDDDSWKTPKDCRKELKELNITSKDKVPDYYVRWETVGFPPNFGVTTGIELETGSNFVHFTRTDRRAHVNLGNCKWSSF